MRIPSHLLWLFALVMCVTGLGGTAEAHLTPNSEVKLSVADGRISADIIVPQGEYAFATGNPVTNTAQARETARRYLSDRIRVTGADGRSWQVFVGQPEFVQIAGPPDLHATATFVPPQGAEQNRFDLTWRVLVDTLPNHFALVVLEAPGRERKIIGAIRTGTERLTVDTNQSAMSILGSAIALGARHIATGYDHLLFLLALLLPAPMIARDRRWQSLRAPTATFAKLAKITIAFTIGHSLTLVGATLGGWRLPTAPVEILIAASVLVSALHAIRPIFPGREPVVAGAFGLVHGLAFATLVDDAGAGLASSAVGLLGFNLGIELVQLAVVVAVVPPLLLLSRRRAYPAFRTTGGMACAFAASVWIVARSVDALPDWSPGVIGSLALALIAGFAALFFIRPVNAHQRPAFYGSNRG